MRSLTRYLLILGALALFVGCKTSTPQADSSQEPKGQVAAEPSEKTAGAEPAAGDDEPAALPDQGEPHAAPTDAAAPTEGGEEGAMLHVTSTSFEANGEMPTHLTCEGADTSPALAWAGAPEGTKSFVLIVDDPDAPDPAAPKMTWVHWVLYDLPPHATALPEGAAKTGVPAGARDGHNDWKRPGYGGPCPPIGRHRYFHKVYALDTLLGDLGTPTKADVLEAMEGHVLASGELVGTYQKKKAK